MHEVTSPVSDIVNFYQNFDCGEEDDKETENIPQPKRGTKSARRSTKTDNNVRRQTRRKRTHYSEETLHILEEAFTANEFVNSERKLELSLILKMNEDQIKVWFQNRRKRQKKKIQIPMESKQQLASSLSGASALSTTICNKLWQPESTQHYYATNLTTPMSFDSYPSSVPSPINSYQLYNKNQGSTDKKQKVHIISQHIFHNGVLQGNVGKPKNTYQSPPSNFYNYDYRRHLPSPSNTRLFHQQQHVESAKFRHYISKNLELSYNLNNSHCEAEKFDLAMINRQQNDDLLNDVNDCILDRMFAPSCNESDNSDFYKYNIPKIAPHHHCDLSKSLNDIPYIEQQADDNRTVYPDNYCISDEFHYSSRNLNSNYFKQEVFSHIPYTENPMDTHNLIINLEDCISDKSFAQMAELKIDQTLEDCMNMYLG